MNEKQVLKQKKWNELKLASIKKKQKKWNELKLASIKRRQRRYRKKWSVFVKRPLFKPWWKHWRPRTRRKRPVGLDLFLKKQKRNRKRHFVGRAAKMFNYKKNLPFSRKITIKVKQNNIFFHVQNIIRQETLLVGSVGKYRIRTSRKLLRWVYERIFNRFFWEAKKTFNNGGLIIILTAPRKLRKWILRLVRTYRVFKVKHSKFLALKAKAKWNSRLKVAKFQLAYRPLLIKVLDKKIFNGCRFSKKRRKKRKPRRKKKN